MRLKKIQVTNFRSVEDSGEFDVDGVTCLVGKNEAGKSALLLALAALNPNEATPVTLDRERDYPRRHLIRYKQFHGDEEAMVVRTAWELAEAEMGEISEDIGDGVLKSPMVEVSRRYGTDIEVYAELDYSAYVKHDCDLIELDADERSVLGSPGNDAELIAELEGLQSPTERQLQLLEHLNQRPSARARMTELVTGRLPTFMYVSSYDRMDGAIQIEETRDRIESGEIEAEEQRGCRLFVDFLDYAGVAIDEIANVSTYETFNAMLQGASSNITTQVLEYWSQNPDLDVEVRIDQARPNDRAPFNEGTVARARIKNNLHKVDTPFSERSAGFVWFFSFLVKFAQMTNKDGTHILLLDEPGLSLHGKAQADLLRFIDEKLSPSHQVIYSTHSPFMIPVHELRRVRLVEDKVESSTTSRRSDGTRVSQDVLKVEGDTLFPLQGALGYEATQTLFVGEHTLLVEGPSDILYLHAFSNELKARNRAGLDSRWTVCPAGGIDRIMPFVTLFAGKKLHIAVLSDEAKGAKKKVEKMRRSEILQAGHFFTIGDLIDQGEADIEDIFDPDIYAEIVNRSYALPEPHLVTVEKLDQETSTLRIVKKVEAMFNVMPDTISMFDHYTPADWLIRHPDVLSGQTEAIERTLSRAERVIETFNALLA